MKARSRHSSSFKTDICNMLKTLSKDGIFSGPTSFNNNHSTEMCSGSEAGSCLRPIDSCITPLKAQGPLGPMTRVKEKKILRSYRALPAPSRPISARCSSVRHREKTDFLDMQISAPITVFAHETTSLLKKRPIIFSKVLYGSSRAEIDLATPQSTTQWRKTRPSKVNLPHAMNLSALCGANLVALRSNFWSNETCEFHCLAAPRNN